MTDTGGTNGIFGNLLQLICEFFRAHNPFRYNDDVGVFAVRTGTIDTRCNCIHIKGKFRHDDDFRTRCNTAVKRDVAAMSTHNFYNGNTFVRGHRITQFVDDVQAGIYRRIETERVVGIFKVVVNRTGDTDGGNAVFAERFCALERSVAADYNQAFDTVFFQGIQRFLLTFYRQHFQTSCRSQTSTAALYDVGNATHFHLCYVIFNQTCVAALNSIYFHTEENTRTNNRTDCRVHTRSIAATC